MGLMGLLRHAVCCKSPIQTRPSQSNFRREMTPQACTLEDTGSNADKAVWSNPVAIQKG